MTLRQLNTSSTSTGMQREIGGDSQDGQYVDSADLSRSLTTAVVKEKVQLLPHRLADAHHIEG